MTRDEKEQARGDPEANELSYKCRACKGCPDGKKGCADDAITDSRIFDEAMRLVTIDRLKEPPGPSHCIVCGEECEEGDDVCSDECARKTRTRKFAEMNGDYYD